jgi:hypothetical protein
VKGREQALVLAQDAPTYAGGRAPPIPEVLDWLLDTEAASPEAFVAPTGLLDRAVESGYIAEVGRGEFASRIVALVEQGYLDGDLPDLEQATDEQRLELSDGLRLTMKAHDRSREAASASRAIAFYGPVVAKQIAAGDIANYGSLSELLDEADRELGELADVDETARDEARRLLDILRGKATDLSGQVVTGAGGALLASLIGRLIGLS